MQVNDEVDEDSVGVDAVPSDGVSIATDGVSLAVDDSVTFQNFVRVFARLRPIHRVESRNKMNRRDHKIKREQKTRLMGSRILLSIG